MPHREERLHYLWKAYQENLATPEEARELLDYFATQPPEVMEPYLTALDEDYSPDPFWQLPVTPEEIRQRALQAVTTVHQRSIRRKTITRRLAIAAGIIAVAATGAWLYLHSGLLTRAQPPSIAAATIAAPLPPAPFTVTSRTLPDGSSLKLAGSAQVQYHPPAQQQVRKMALTGKCYFKIARNASLPCVIETGSIATEILGTSLTVDAVAADDSVRITLETGLVSIKHNNQVLLRLQPGQQVAIHRTTGGYKLSQVNIAQNQQWIGADINGNNRPYAVVVAELEKRYNVHFSFTEASLAQQLVHASFQATASLEEVLQVLTLGTPGTCTQQGDNIIISRKKNL